MRIFVIAMLVVGFWAGVWVQLDEEFYMQRAVEVAGGELLPEHGFYRSPIYPYIVALTASARSMDEGGVLLDGYPWP